MEVNGPMARSAADLALALDVIAGPDEMWEGIAYKLALPPPRHGKLADFRVLVIDTNPLCPTAASIRLALDTLADRFAKAGCQVSRANPKMPDLGRTIRNYAELLLAFFSLDLSPGERVRYDAAAQVLSPEDQSLSAYELHGLTISRPEYLRASRVRVGLRARWQALFQDFDVVLCPLIVNQHRTSTPPIPLKVFWYRRRKGGKGGVPIGADWDPIPRQNYGI
jgi:amidase